MNKTMTTIGAMLMIALLTTPAGAAQIIDDPLDPCPSDQYPMNVFCTVKETVDRLDTDIEEVEEIIKESPIVRTILWAVDCALRGWPEDCQIL
jgi:hypothetical protein